MFNYRGLMYFGGAIAAVNLVKTMTEHNWVYAISHAVVGWYLFSWQYEKDKKAGQQCSS